MGKLGEMAERDIINALAGKRGLVARTIITELAGRLHVSPGYLYRLTSAIRSTDRKSRCDTGSRRLTVSAEVENFMLDFTLTGDLSASHVLFITARHFGLAEDFMSEATYNIWLRRARLSRRDNKRDLRPSRRFEAPYANHLHHYDTTVSAVFYANDDGTIGYEPSSQRYKNKPGNRKPRIVLYALIDDYSRVLFARFYFSENALNLLDFVLHAWSQKDDKRFPFFGIPEHVYADLGAPYRSQKFQHALNVLGVASVETTPSHATEFGSRKHGKVERTFGEGLLGEFMKLTARVQFASLDEMNACLFDWLVRINNKKNRTTGEIRFARWLRSVGTPRSMPNADLFKLLHYDRYERTVARDLTIALNGKRYQLPDRKPFLNWVDAKIELYAYPGTNEKITVVYDHHEEEITALAPVFDIAFDYKRLPKTDREERIEALKAQPARTIDPTTLYDSNLPYLPKKSAPFDDTKIAEKTVEQPDGTRRPSFAPIDRKSVV